MKKLVLGITLLLAMVATAFAVDTPFSNNIFSATFNSPVTQTVDNNPTNTTYHTLSYDQGVSEGVDYRIVTHEIPAGVESSNWYLQQEVQKNNGTLVNTSTGSYQGRVFTYGYYTFVGTDGTPLAKRTRIIILSNTTVLFVSIAYPASFDAESAVATRDGIWTALANSVVIK